MSDRKLKLFVWTGFCPDYNGGLAFAVAEDEVEARELIEKEMKSEAYEWGDLEIRELNCKSSAYVYGGS